MKALERSRANVQQREASQLEALRTEGHVSRQRWKVSVLTGWGLKAQALSLQAQQHARSWYQLA